MPKVNIDVTLRFPVHCLLASFYADMGNMYVLQWVPAWKIHEIVSHFPGQESH